MIRDFHPHPFEFRAYIVPKDLAALHSPKMDELIQDIQSWIKGKVAPHKLLRGGKSSSRPGLACRIRAHSHAQVSLSPTLSREAQQGRSCAETCVADTNSRESCNRLLAYAFPIFVGYPERVIILSSYCTAHAILISCVVVSL